MQNFFSATAQCRVRYLDLPGGGVPLLFIHGLGCASSYDYPRVVSDPAWSSRRSILIDLPGSGYSDRPQSYGYSTREQASVVGELVEHLGLNRFFLYGHSMGGSIAIEVAASMPGKIAGLMVSEPNFRAGGGMYSRMIAAQTEDEFVAHGYQKAIAANAENPWSGSLQNSDPSAVWRAAVSLVSGIEPDWYQLFAQLKIPKTLIFGELSLPDEDFTALQQTGLTAIVPSAGHSMSWENPAGLARVLAEQCRA
ncbi:MULTISPECIES: alpha/beta fold hydrolase [unclassified Cedecea]|uniref:alpha/beta fold hydrolase n=1 Tax=unclassified Cedecea TaxID=2649846 RepID=UPI003017DBF6